MNKTFLLSNEKLTSVDPIVNSIDDIWDKLQFIKSVADAIHFQAETSYTTLSTNLGIKQANSLIGCLNLIVVMAEEIQCIIESNIEKELD